MLSGNATCLEQDGLQDTTVYGRCGTQRLPYSEGYAGLSSLGQPADYCYD